MEAWDRMSRGMKVKVECVCSRIAESLKPVVAGEDISNCH